MFRKGTGIPMIWVVGSKGMLGQEVCRAFRHARLEFVSSDKEVDFTDPLALRDFVAGKAIKWIINCAAYTAVDKAEEDREVCYRVNVLGPKNLGELAQEIGARVLHISTDYVFDGKGLLGSDGQKRGYLESDPTGPQGYYGLTKAQGEEALFKVAPQSVIFRTAWLYGIGGPNFVSTMLKLMKTRETIGVVADQWGTPTWAADLAEAVVVALKSTDLSSGIYHFTGEGITNWFEFALEIQRQGQAKGLLTTLCQVNALTTEQYPTKTARPQWSVLEKGKIKKVLGLEIKSWQENLKLFFETHSKEILL